MNDFEQRDRRPVPPAIVDKPKRAAAKKYEQLRAQLADVDSRGRALGRDAHAATADLHHAERQLVSARGRAAVATELGEDPGDALTDATRARDEASARLTELGDVESKLAEFGTRRRALEGALAAYVNTHFLDLAGELDAERVQPDLEQARAALEQARLAVARMIESGVALRALADLADGLSGADVRAEGLDRAATDLERAIDELEAPRLFVKYRHWNSYEPDSMPAALAACRDALFAGEIDGERGGDVLRWPDAEPATPALGGFAA